MPILQFFWTVLLEQRRTEMSWVSFVIAFLFGGPAVLVAINGLIVRHKRLKEDRKKVYCFDCPCCGELDLRHLCRHYSWRRNIVTHSCGICGCRKVTTYSLLREGTSDNCLTLSFVE